MKILFLTYWIRHIQEYWEPLVQSLGDIEPVYLCHNSLDQDYPGKSRSLEQTDAFLQLRHWGEQAQTVVDIVDNFRPDLIFVWNGNVPFYRDVVGELRAWFDTPILFWELGWLPQKQNLWADPQGTLGGSLLANWSFEQLMQIPPDPDLLTRKMEYYQDLVEERPVDFPYLFLPLQLEDDTNFLAYASYSSMEEVVEEAVSLFPNKDIVVRPHPLAKDELRGDWGEKVQLYADGSVENWIAHSEAVVGVNSTVLVESLLYEKRVLQLGQSVLSNKGLVWEGKESASQFLTGSFDANKVLPALERLVTVEIDYRKVSWADLERHPLVGEIVRTVRS